MIDREKAIELYSMIHELRELTLKKDVIIDELFAAVKGLENENYSLRLRLGDVEEPD